MKTSDHHPENGAPGALLRNRGFSLIELMIVVAIIAVLAAVAYPGYINQVVKTRRAAATACLSEYANYMERYFTTNLRYDQDAGGTANVLPTLDCSAASQTGNSYGYAFAASPKLAPGVYKVLATPKSGTAQATRDGACAALGIDQSGQRYYQGTRTDSNGLSTCWRQ